MAQHSEMHILLSAMRVAVRTRVSDTEYTMAVEHPAQVQAFESAMNTLMPFLRDRLRNDHLSISAHIDKKADIPKPLPQKEFLMKIVAENPAMGDFLKSIDAEIYN